jgi:hypothetical protein
MNPILKGGLVLGALCGSWIFINGLLGWYKDPAMYASFVPIVTIMEVVVLVWALRKTAAQGRTYSGQVTAGTLIALIGGAIIVCASMIFSSVLYPNYFEEINAMMREMALKSGQSEAAVNAAIDAARGSFFQTSFGAAMAGFMGTLFTGIIASAIIAIWIRAKGPAAPAARV